MKTCRKCGEIAPELEGTRNYNCDDCKYGRHGLKASEIIKIAEQQNWKCAISGKPLERREGNPLQVIDLSTPSKKQVHIDHCHKTNQIRGLLIEKANWLLDEFEKGSYGTLEEPEKLREYKANPPAVVAIGVKLWK